MDTAQWPQEIVVKPLEEIVVTNNTCSSKPSTTASLERKPTPTPTTTARPQKEQALNCPRCNSTNTKFCYYNNYSLTQPRYFCKTCRRYWTEGGTLRNIPVGGGSRKNKRSSSSSASLNSNSSTSTSAHKKVVISHDLITQNLNHGQDLNLAFPSSTTTSSSTAAQVMTNFSASALGVLNEISSSRGNLMSNFMGMPPHQDPSQGYHTSGFAPIIHDHFKPALNFTLDGIGNGYVSLQGDTNNGNNNNNKLLFPFEDLNHQVSSTISTSEQQNREHGSYSTGYWTGMLNVGGSGDGGGSGGGNELELASYYHASQ